MVTVHRNQFCPITTTPNSLHPIKLKCILSHSHVELNGSVKFQTISSASVLTAKCKNDERDLLPNLIISLGTISI